MDTNRRNYRRDVQSVLPLVAKVAWGTYARLPAYVKAFVDVEDLIQYGILALHNHQSRWNRRRGAYTTYAYRVVTSELANYLASFNAEKRQHESVSLDATELNSDLSRTVILKLGSADVVFDDIAFADSYQHIYHEASEIGRVLLGNFIGVPSGETLPNKRMQTLRTTSYRKTLQELRGLCQKHSMDFNGLLRLSRGGVRG